MTTLDYARARDFLFHEATLLDEWQLNDWLELFTEEGIYWIPIDEDRGPEDNTSLIYDISIRRQERVFRLLETPVPSQEPRSRTIHAITNVRVGDPVDAVPGADHLVHSYQMITELRAGDFRQTGLGEQRTFVGRCEHHLVETDGDLRIVQKKLILINRDISIRNLTFIA